MSATIGLWQWEDYPEVGSTNDLAKEESKCFSGYPTVYTAQAQTAGRGRRGRQWVSEKGNLFMSLLFKAELPISDMVFVTSLSIAETVNRLTTDLKINIKWPNDVLIDEQKICGILIEAAENETIVIGIGVNLVASPDNAQTIYKTTSLKELGFDISREKFLQTFLLCFDANVDICRRCFDEIRTKWLSYAYRLNQKIKIMQNKKQLEGIFKGIDEQGLLLLEQEERIIKISVGDVFA